MVIRESKNVDKSGLVYLRYLVDWKSPKSNTLALCKLLSRTFSEECPVFTEDRSKKEIKASNKGTKKKSRRFRPLRRFSLSRSKSTSVASVVHEPGAVEQPEKSILHEKPEQQQAVQTDNHHNHNHQQNPKILTTQPSTNNPSVKSELGEHHESPFVDSTSDSSISKGSAKSVSFSEEATMDDIPDMVYDESLDSLYSSSFESLYSDRSVTILTALKNQKIAPVFNSSFESLLSEKSISYLLDLEKQWARPVAGKARSTTNSPQSIHSARSDRQRTIRPRRSLSMNKKDALRRLSQLSIESSDQWPTPPSTTAGGSEEGGNLTRQNTFDSDGWPDPPPSDGRNSSASNDWPEPPIDILPPPDYPMLVSSARDRTLSDLVESPFENVLSPSKEKSFLPLLEEKKKQWQKEAENDFKFLSSSEYKSEQKYPPSDGDDDFELNSINSDSYSSMKPGYPNYGDTLDQKTKNRSDYEFNSLDRKFQENGLFKHESAALMKDIKYESKETQYESSKKFASTETQYNTWDKPDKQLLEALREGRTEYLDENNIAEYLDENNITPTPSRKFYDYDAPVCNGGDLFKLDFTEDGDPPQQHGDHQQQKQQQHSSPESTPRHDNRLTITKGGMVKHAEPIENKKRRWPFRRKNSEKSIQQQKQQQQQDDCKCDHGKPNTKSWSHSLDCNNDELRDSIKLDLDDTTKNNKEQHCSVNRSKSMEDSKNRNDTLYEHVNNNNNNNNNINNHNHHDNYMNHHNNNNNNDGSPTKTNGIYERVSMTMTNGHKHRDSISEAKIYEPIAFKDGMRATKSDNHLTCRYKSVGCLAHTDCESDSINHNDEAVGHHMYLLLNKVEYLTGEVKNLKQKIKTLESET